MKVTIPSSWNELTDYQQREIIHIIQHTDLEEDFTDSFIQIVSFLLRKDDSTGAYLRMRKILREYPLSVFKDAAGFLWEKPNLYSFPKISGLREPSVRMGDCTIEQFSICDTLLYRYTKEKKEVYLRQLVASLYRDGEFSSLKLPGIADITDRICIKEAQRIGFIFGSVRNYIVDSYPKIFPKKSEEDEEATTLFKKKRPEHTPFSQIIVMMAADELRLLGNLQESKRTLIYDFFNAFMESKHIHEMKSEALKRM